MFSLHRTSPDEPNKDQKIVVEFLFYYLPFIAICLSFIDMYNTPYTNSSFLNRFPELVMARRGNLDELCQLAKIPKEAVTGDNVLIPFELFIELLEVSASQLDSPLFSLELAHRQDITVLGPITNMLSECQSFQEVMEKMIEYFSLIISGFEIKISTTESVLEIAFDVNMPNLYYRPQFQNYLLATSTMLLRELAGDKYHLRGCFFTRLEHDPNLQSQFAQFFRCPVVFGAQQLKLTVDKGVLQHPPSAIQAKLVQQMNRLVHSYDGVVNQVEKVVEITLANGGTRLADVAGLIGYSPRTLHRHLEQAHTSFRAILDSVRYSQARQYLNNSHYSLNDIAVLLGYSNQSAFTRSYLRWSSETPSATREKLSASL